jgi:hypothetical protein
VCFELNPTSMVVKRERIIGAAGSNFTQGKIDDVKIKELLNFTISIILQ